VLFRSATRTARHKDDFKGRFDGVFMILSYSLDVRHVRLHILFLKFYFIFKFYQFAYKFITFDKKTQQGYGMKNAPFFPKSAAVWDKFCTRIRAATNAEKIINDNI
jgi:hypothetical protein